MLKHKKKVPNKDGGAKAISPHERAKKYRKDKCNQGVDRMLEDLVESLGNLPALTFVLTGEGCVGLGPTFGSALDIVIRAYRGEYAEFSGPFAAVESAERMAKKKAGAMYMENVAMVERRVHQLKEAGANFILCWQVGGDSEPRLDCSRDRGWDDVCAELIGAVQQEIARQVAP